MLNTWKLNYDEITKDSNFTLHAFKKTLDKVNAFYAKWNNNSDILNSSTLLRDFLDEYKDLYLTQKELKHCHFETMLNLQIDLNNKDLQAKMVKINDIHTTLEEKLHFVSITLGKIDKEKQQEIMVDPMFTELRGYLSIHFDNARFNLTEAEEKVISKLAFTGDNSWVNFLEQELPKVKIDALNEDGHISQIVLTEVSKYFKSKNTEIREFIRKSYDKAMMDKLSIAEAEMNVVLQQHRAIDELRGCERPDLRRIISEGLSPEFVDNLVAAVSKTNHLARKFLDIKRRLLGLDELLYHERSVEWGELPSNISFDSAYKFVEDAFIKLHPEFHKIYLKTFEEGRVDVFPRASKSSGGFCASNGALSNAYILLNHTGNIFDVKTLAHEFGHAIHHELMLPKVNPLCCQSATSLAEIPSTFMEGFALDEIRNALIEDEALALKVNDINSFFNTVHRQIAAYKFELELHTEGKKLGHITSKQIGGLFAKNMSELMPEGKGFEADHHNYWIEWSHFRRNFYVFTYASGLMISKMCQLKWSSDEDFKAKFIKFLESGMSVTTIESLEILGIDANDKNVWNDVLITLESDIDKLEKELIEKNYI